MSRTIYILTALLLAALGASACSGRVVSLTTATTSVSPSVTMPAKETTMSQAAPTETVMPPGCTSPASPSPAMTEGPYYKAGSPERTSLLEEGMPGTKLVLSGSVLDSNCQPVANALLDFWQADSSGVYDNAGYTLRGHQFTDEKGNYKLETVVPGLYPGRTEHIHVKVQAPGGPVLTTQLFFPNVASNESDRIFSPELVIKIVDDAGSSLQAEFNFVVDRP